MDITIYTGRKTNFADGIEYRYCITCKDNSDTDTVYSGLAESLVLKDQDNVQDVIAFQNLKDDNANTLLEDAKQYGFISDYEIKIDHNKLAFVMDYKN